MELREPDGIYLEYGCAKNVFPRTLIEAYGRYTTLHVDKPKRRVSANTLAYTCSALMALIWIALIICT